MDTKVGKHENLFVAVLLLCGPDPEPDVGLASNEYHEWRAESQTTLWLMYGRGFRAEEIWSEYRNWLADRGLAWRGK